MLHISIIIPCRGETIQINAILCIVLGALQYIAILQYVTGFWKKHFSYGNTGFSSKEKNIATPCKTI